MKIDKESSERLSILHFPLIVGVVFIHAYGTNIGLSSGVVGVESPGYWFGFIQNLVSQGIARIAVPLFFLMSGYFFFIGFSWSIENYRNKLNSRLRTLIFPFIFWNLITLFLLALAQYIPVTKVYFSGEKALISTFGSYEYVNAIIGLDRFPISYQFWFIRDLIVLGVLAPLVFLIVKKTPKTFLVGIFFLWFFNLWPIYIPSVAAVAFFYAGAYFASYQISLFSLDRFGPVIFYSYLVILLVDTFSKGSDLNIYIHKIGIVLGVVSVLYLSKHIIGKKAIKNSLIWAGGCSFFVFATHEPLLTVLRKIIYKAIPPNSDMAVLFLYIAIPVLVVTLSILLYLAMKKTVPNVLSAISGGR